MAKGRKTGGRQKGTPNRLTHQFRSRLVDFLSSYMDHVLIGDLKHATAGERLAFISKLITHLIPKAESESAKPADFLGCIPFDTVEQEFSAQREVDSIISGVQSTPDIKQEGNEELVSELQAVVRHSEDRKAIKDAENQIKAMKKAKSRVF